MGCVSSVAQSQVQVLSERHAMQRISGQKNYLMLPVEEAEEGAHVNIIYNNKIVKEFNVRLAVNKVDYYVPVDISVINGKDALIDVDFGDGRNRRHSDIKNYVCWTKIDYTDKIDTTNRETRWRPIYHHTPTYGWMNDPNGMFYKDGVWNLYFQYNPYGSTWENMTWGHSTSTDLVNWTYQGDVIEPDALGTIFSGSSVVDYKNTAGFGEGAIISYYTSAGQSQTQSMAYSVDNGMTFKKYSDNPKSSSIAKEYPCLGAFKDVESVIKDTGVQTVLICAPGLESKRLVSLINQLQLLVKRVAFVPELFGLPTSNITARGMMEEQAVVLRVQNNLARKSNRIMKRIFDIVATVCGGLLILPILAIVAVLIYLDSPGPIVFGHKRVGQGGKEFPCYKFRSMVPNAQEALEVYLKENPAAREEWERDFKLKDDPRVTRIGKFLRKTSLDELPQLWNVLVGDMSLVGPRPIVRDEIVKYGDYINDFYLVPPGITGVWQVSGRSDTTYEERVLMDSWYVHNWSVWIDIVYLLKTVLAVVKSKGAY